MICLPSAVFNASDVLCFCPFFKWLVFCWYISSACSNRDVPVYDALQIVVYSKFSVTVRVAPMLLIALLIQVCVVHVAGGKSNGRLRWPLPLCRHRCVMLLGSGMACISGQTVTPIGTLLSVSKNGRWQDLLLDQIDKELVLLWFSLCKNDTHNNSHNWMLIHEHHIFLLDSYSNNCFEIKRHDLCFL